MINQKGQGLIEATVILSLLFTGLFFILSRLFVFQKSLALDFIMQKTAICLTENRWDCLARFRQRANDLGLTIRTLHADDLPTHYAVKLLAQDRFHFSYQKELKLHLK